MPSNGDATVGDSVQEALSPIPRGMHANGEPQIAGPLQRQSQQCVVGYSYITDCGRVARQPPEGLAILALMQPDQEVISAWRASAPFWEKHREIIRQMFAPVTQALVEDGLIGSGNTVLDIATGPGEPASTIAALVGF